MKKERVDRLLLVGAAEKERYLQNHVGKELTVVPENCIDGYTEGYSENYIRVYVNGETEKRPVKVRVLSLFKGGVKAERL